MEWAKDKPSEAGLYWVFDEVTGETEEIRVYWWHTKHDSSLHLVAWVQQDREYWELSEFDWFQKINKPEPPAEFLERKRKEFMDSVVDQLVKGLPVKEVAFGVGVLEMTDEFLKTLSQPTVTTKDNGDGTYTHTFDFTKG